MVLDEVLSELDKFFSPGWFTPFKLEEDTTPEDEIERVSQFKEFLFRSLSKTIDLFHASIFEGEYISYEKVVNLCSEISQQLGNIPVFDFWSTREEGVLQDPAEKYFREPLTRTIHLYKHLANEANQKINNKDAELIYNKDEDDIYSNLLNDDFSDTTDDLIRLFSYHIQICEQELSTDSFNDQKSNLYKLIRAYYEIGKISVENQEIHKLVHEKCAFLINKLIIRVKKESSTPINILVGGNFKKLSVIDYQNRFYDSAKEYIETHYSLSSVREWKQNLHDSAKENKLSQQKEVKDIIRQIKYYHKVEGDLEGLRNLQENIKNKYLYALNTSCKFDKHSLAICLNYSSNCALSLVIQKNKKTKDISKVSSEYDKVNEFQKLTDMNNFYPHREYLRYLISHAESLAEEQDIKDISKLEELISQSKALSKRYDYCIDWSKRNLSYVVQLPFNECFINTGQEKYKRVFFSSSYFIPLHENQIDFDRDAIKSELERVQNKIMITKDREAIKSIIAEYGKADVRSMEILAMFSALVAFVVGSVQKGATKTAYEAALFTASLSLSLGLFVFLILGVHRGGIAKISQHKWLIIIILALILIFFSLLLVYDNKTLTLAAILDRFFKLFE